MAWNNGYDRNGKGWRFYREDAGDPGGHVSHIGMLYTHTVDSMPPMIEGGDERDQRCT